MNTLSDFDWMVNNIDLSTSNILSGEIPQQITKLSGLVAINCQEGYQRVWEACNS